MSVKISPSILSADFANMGVAVSQLADWGLIGYIATLWTECFAPTLLSDRL